MTRTTEPTRIHAKTPANAVSRKQLQARLQALPRAKVDITPTPLQDCRRLSEALGGPRILIKRDDLTGLAYGGTKTRSLGFILGEAATDGTDTVIISGFAKSVSNHCRLFSAAAAKLGMKPILVLGGPGFRKEQSNTLLCNLVGADIRLVDTEDVLTLGKICNDLADELRHAGRKPTVLGVQTCYSAYGALGSVDCFLEILDQLDDLQASADYLYFTSQGGTQAGFVLAGKALQSPTHIVSISSMPAGLRSWPGRVELHADVAGWANDLARLLDINVNVEPSDVVNYPDYIGAGYGILTPGCIEAIRLAASTEGIILDPLYTSKGMAGLIDHIRSKRIRADETVVFVHTGGLPTLFDYSAALTD